MPKVGSMRAEWIEYDLTVLRRYPDYNPELTKQVSRGFIGGAVSMLRFFTERLPKDRLGQEAAIREMRDELTAWATEFEIGKRPL